MIIEELDKIEHYFRSLMALKLVDLRFEIKSNKGYSKKE